MKSRVLLLAAGSALVTAFLWCDQDGTRVATEDAGPDAKASGDALATGAADATDTGGDAGSEGATDAAADGPHAARFPVKHVLYVIKENRSFDNYLGRFPGVRGASTGKICDGGTVPLRELLDRNGADIDHSWAGSLAAYNDGGMNCFDGLAAFTSSGKGPPGVYPGGGPLGYQAAEQRDIPNYWLLAQTFAISDNFYSAEPGPSFPNHLYAIASTSGGVIGLPSYGHPAYPQAPKVGGCDSATSCPEPGEAGLRPTNVPLQKPGGPGVWGCDADPTLRVPMLDTEGKEVEIYPCMDFQTLGDELSAAGVSWKMYGSLATGSGYAWTTYDAIRHIRASEAWTEHVVDVATLFTDVQNGTLPSVAWISPSVNQTEHPGPGVSVCDGENWTVALLQALQAGTQWKDTAVFITYDEAGGFYDHVPPPSVDRFGLGFRVPLFIVSPWVKGGTIDHSRGDLSSVLKFIEADFNLPALASRDTDIASTDLQSNFDWNGPGNLTLPVMTQRTTTPTSDAGCQLTSVTPACAPLTAVPGSQVPAYVPVVKHLGSCSQAQVAAYGAACPGAGTSCGDWFSNPANAACVACIDPKSDAGAPRNDGATIRDGSGRMWSNIPGCLALLDGNAKCASALDLTYQCSYFACSSPVCFSGPVSTLTDCFTAAYGGACVRYVGPSNTACQADVSDGGTYARCSTLSDVAQAVCGDGT